MSTGGVRLLRRDVEQITGPMLEKMQGRRPRISRTPRGAGDVGGWVGWGANSNHGERKPGGHLVLGLFPTSLGGQHDFVRQEQHVAATARQLRRAGAVPLLRYVFFCALAIRMRISIRSSALPLASA